MWCCGDWGCTYLVARLFWIEFDQIAHFEPTMSMGLGLVGKQAGSDRHRRVAGGHFADTVKNLDSRAHIDWTRCVAQVKTTLSDGGRHCH
jgi:hypothetical protein